MTTIIRNDAELRTIIPNVLVTAEGETSFIDKLATYLEAAEQWAEETFTGETIFNELTALEETNSQRQLLARLVATEAFMQAIPNLDLVLTPNGFGVVSNSTVAPASKDRVGRLLAQLEVQRDNTIEQLLDTIPSDDWLQTTPGQFFSSTFFPNLNLTTKLGITTHRWTEYNRLRSKLIEIETNLANTYFSPELMAAFRTATALHFEGSSILARTVINSIRTLELSLLTDNPPHPQFARDIVNTIRQNPAIFPEWHASDTAKLFTPELFSNKKSSAGYWF